VKAKLLTYWRQLAAMPGSDGPLLRWGLLVVAVVLFWAVLFEPYQAWSEMRKDLLHAQINKVERLRGLQASAAAWAQAKDDEAAALEATRPRLFQAASYAMAQSELSSYLQGIYVASHLQLDSQRLLDMEPVAQVGEKIAVYFRMRGALADMLGFVDAVARGEKLVLLDDLYIGVDRFGKATLQFKAVAFRPLAEDS